METLTLFQKDFVGARVWAVLQCARGPWHPFVQICFCGPSLGPATHLELWLSKNH